jgi:hypothetical protein
MTKHARLAEPLPEHGAESAVSRSMLRRLEDIDNSTTPGSKGFVPKLMVS